MMNTFRLSRSRTSSRWQTKPSPAPVERGGGHYRPGRQHRTPTRRCSLPRSPAFFTFGRRRRAKGNRRRSLVRSGNREDSSVGLDEHGTSRESRDDDARRSTLSDGRSGVAENGNASRATGSQRRRAIQLNRAVGNPRTGDSWRVPRVRIPRVGHAAASVRAMPADRDRQRFGETAGR